MINVTVVLLNSGLASTAIGPIEVFHCAGTLWNTFMERDHEPAFQVQIVSVDREPVVCDYPLTLTVDGSIDDVHQTDLIFIPTGGINATAMLDRHQSLLPWLVARYEAGAMIASVCTGVAFAAAAGLLSGRRATTHWASAADYARRFPDVDWQPDFLVTEHDGMLCGGGVNASVDLAMYLVEKLCGHRIALETAKALLVDMPRARQSGYAFLPLSPPHHDAQVRAAEEAIQRDFAEPIHLKDIADRLGMSPRNLARRFRSATGKSPAGYLQEVRVAAARDWLEKGRDPIQVIGRRVGYEDLAFFRRIFGRHVGMSPSEYRTRFGSAIPQQRQAAG
jgi:transcriptional regulator GlxA family with amidase domain